MTIVSPTRPASALRRARTTSGGLLVAGSLVLAAAASPPARAATISFDTDPFTGSTALTTPGRQVFSGLERTLPSFNPATDTFAFSATAFPVGALSFVNAPVGGIPTSGANVIVLDTVDDDNNPATPFGAGSAATVIAGQVAVDGAGFFVYHNSALNVNRLVFSTNLNDAGADLSVLARIASPTGLDAIGALPQFTSANFVAAVPEPSTYALMALGIAGLAVMRRRRQD